MKIRFAAIAVSTLIALSTAVPASASTDAEDPAAGPIAAAGAPAATGSKITYSRDGKIYQARGDLTSPRVVATYDAVKDDLDAIEVSQDGTTIAYRLHNAATWDSRVIVRSASTGAVLRSISGTFEKVGSLTGISPNGKTLLRSVSGTDYLTTVSTGTTVNAKVPAGYDARGYTSDGLRLMLQSDYTVKDFTIRRFNISTKQTAVTYTGANLRGEIKDVAPDGSVIFERSAKTCGSSLTTAAGWTGTTGTSSIVTNRDDVRAGSVDGKWVIAVRASAPRTYECRGDSSERNVVFTVMSRTGAVATAGTRVLSVTASHIDWSK